MAKIRFPTGAKGSTTLLALKIFHIRNFLRYTDKVQYVNVVPIDKGEQDFERSAGYCFKDRRMPGFAWKSHNMTQEHIDLCIATYERHQHGYGVGKTMLSKANYMKKMYGFYFRNFDPLPVSLWTTIKHGIREQQYALSASFVTNSNGIKFHRANALWRIIRNPTETTTKDVIATCSDFYDRHHSEYMNTVLWDEHLRPGYTPKNRYKEGFNSPRVPKRDAFAVNADFIPFVADPETPTVYPNVPKLPEMPYDDLTFEQIRNLAAQQRADALGADGRPLPSVATEIPNFPDNTAPDMNSAEPAPWVPRDPRTAANVTEQEGERETSDEFGIPMDSRAAFEARLAALRYSTPPRRSSAPASPSTPSSASSMTSPAYSASPPVSPSRAPTSPTTSTWSSTFFASSCAVACMGPEHLAVDSAAATSASSGEAAPQQRRWPTTSHAAAPTPHFHDRRRRNAPWNRRRGRFSRRLT